MLACERVKTEGVAVDQKTLVEMKQMSEYLGMDFAQYFGSISLEEDGYKGVY